MTKFRKFLASEQETPDQLEATCGSDVDPGKDGSYHAKSDIAAIGKLVWSSGTDGSGCTRPPARPAA